MEQNQWPGMPQRRRKWNWYIVGAIASGAALLALIAAIAVSIATDGDFFAGKESEVESLCFEEITDQLRDPDSAEFYDLNDILKTEEGEIYTLEGKVRARNGFGGMVNSGFSCGVIYGDGDPDVHAWTY